MIRNFTLVAGLLYSLTLPAAPSAVALQPSDDRHLSNLTQLTFDGDIFIADWSE